MALTGSQKVTVAEITYETYELIDSLASGLNADQETEIVAYIATWKTGESPLRNSHVKLKGGRDGADFDNERKREFIRRSIRKMFGLPLISDEVDGSGSYAIPTIAVF